MQTHIFDPYEFDSSASEETLRFSFAKHSDHRDLAEFESACIRESRASWSPLRAPVPLEQFHRFAEVRAHLRRFGCSLEPFSALGVVAVLSDDWNDLELLLESPGYRMWLHWDTTA